MVKVPTADGPNANVYLLQAAEPTNNYIFVIHEWWGLNDHIKREAERLFNDVGNVNVMALDMYDGKVATTRDSARSYMMGVQQARAENIIKGALAYAGDDAKVSTIGWCFGGGWSLQATLMLSQAKQAAGCVMYYGMPEQNKERLKMLGTDVLGIFATEDAWITPEVVEEFEKKARKATRNNISIYQFEANHGFANPSSERYSEDAAKRAYALTLEFLKARY